MDDLQYARALAELGVAESRREVPA
jgi:hypothetical protein